MMKGSSVFLILPAIVFLFNVMYLASYISPLSHLIERPFGRETPESEDSVDEKVWRRPAVVNPDFCQEEMDEGIIIRVNSSRKDFCSDSPNSSITVFHYTNPHYLTDRPNNKGKPTEFIASVFHQLTLDLRNVQVHKPIESLLQDGAGHDPRFRFDDADRFTCACDAFNILRLELFNIFPDPRRELESQVLTCNLHERAPREESASEDHLDIPQRVMVISRKDDHNPFFQTSVALNAWIMMQVVGWNPTSVELMFLDDGFPTPTEDLQQLVISSSLTSRVWKGPDVRHKRVTFHNVMFVPYETTGPLMSRLNDDSAPCHASHLITRFKTDVLSRFALMPKRALDATSALVMTLLSRRDYQGRVVRRKLLNEADVMVHFQRLYPRAKVRSIDASLLTMKEQLELMQDTDVLIGMHGAGMVNVLWLPPGASVIEIFPKRKKRWGYRNLCQYTGCRYRDYRGGRDQNGRSQDKVLDVLEFAAFVQAELQTHVAYFATRSGWQEH